MFCLYARNKDEAYFLKASDSKDEVFNYAYKYQHSLYEKGGWAIEVRCAITNLIVKDDRFLA